MRITDIYYFFLIILGDKHKTIVRLDNKLNPKLSAEAFVAPSATIAGNVEVNNKYFL